MPLYEYRCGDCGEVSERLVRLSEASAPHVCSCGGDARRIPSTFAPLKVLHSIPWSAIAPLDERGKAMSQTEAAKAGAVSTYSPDEQYRVEAHARQQDGRLTEQRKERAKRDAWKQIRTERKVEA